MSGFETNACEIRFRKPNELLTQRVCLLNDRQLWRWFSICRGS